MPEGSAPWPGIGCHYMAPGWTARPSTFTRWAARACLGRPGAVHERKTCSPTSATAPTSTAGLLAIRRGIAAGVNITYKILYNDAVAMTGGQQVGERPDHPRQVLRSESVGAEGWWS